MILHSTVAPPSKKRQLLTIVIVVGWLCAAIAGIGLILAYEGRKGTTEPVARSWPDKTKIQANEGGPTLLMFAHPHCPCTRASLGELEKLMARHQGDVKAIVVFSKPANAAEDWDQTDLWQLASSIPGVQVMQDHDNVEARRFHVTTSGQTLLYDRYGHLLFSGGITMARGHAGDNPGCDAVESLLSQGSARVDRTPVFGCPIITPSASN